MFRRSQIARALALLVSLAAIVCAGAGLFSRAGARGQEPQEAASSRPRKAGEAGAPDGGRQQQQTRPTPRPTPSDETIDNDEVERVETDLTNVLFTAIDKNRRFITTIRQEDIEVYEDGVKQEIFTFQRETDRPLSLAILIDTSVSQERTLPEEKSAAQAFVEAVIRPGKDEVAVVSFTGEVVLEQGLTGNASRVRQAINKVEFVPPAGYIGSGQVIGTPPINNNSLLGWTAIWDALWVTSREVLSETSDKTRRAIILITDGEDTKSQMKMAEAIDSTVKADAIIYSIGIGDNFYDGVNEGTLRKLSEHTGGRAYFPRNEEDLRDAFAQIQQELRSQYLVAYSPTKKAKDGSYRQVRINVVNPELRKQNLRLTYRQGYFSQTASNK